MRRLYWIGLLLLASCELIVDVDVPYKGDKIVLNAIQSLYAPWGVQLTKTKYILDERSGDFPPVGGGQVKIFDSDGSSYDLEEAAPGYYWTTKTPEEGKTYRIVARADGFNDIEAQMTVPKAVKIIEVKWDSSNIKKTTHPNPSLAYSHGDVPFTVTFSDPGDQRNYYIVVVDYWYSRTYTDSQTQVERTDTLASYARVWVTDPSVASEEDHKSRFSDLAFNGKTYKVPVVAQFNFDPNSTVYEINVKLYSISEEYFKYEESRELFNQSSGDPFAEPVHIYTNVKNGLGIFGGFSIDQRTFGRKFPD